MSDLQFRVDDSPSLVQRAVRSLLPVLFGVLFVYIGSTKFAARSTWVQIFDRIGFGQWFRYFTGAVQIAGGLLTVVPRTRMAGATLIACTMLGATIADLFILHLGPASIAPIVLGATAVTVGWSVWLARD